MQGSSQGPGALAGPGSVLGTWPVLLERETPFHLRALSVVLAYSIPRAAIEVRYRCRPALRSEPKLVWYISPGPEALMRCVMPMRAFSGFAALQLAMKGLLVSFLYIAS